MNPNDALWEKGGVTRIYLLSILLVWLATAVFGAACSAQTSAPLPNGVKAVWDLAAAYREQTPTRERVCLNGLWRWQPAQQGSAALPAGGWGYFKVPGSWPGITDYMQKDSQTVFPHPDWKSLNLGALSSAWYQREITIPASWAGRRITVTAEYLNSFSAIYLDGKKAGEMRFPAGEVDLTSLCKPGSRHLLSMLVTAMPLKAVMLTYTDTNAARVVPGAVARRGLCGDVWLVSAPRAARISDLKIDTSVRRGEIKFKATISGWRDSTILFGVDIRDHGKSVRRIVHPIVGGRGPWADPFDIEFTEKWKPDKLWDIHTPQNVYTAQLTLFNSSGKAIDTTLPVRFGFREFWTEGRDFYLNGSRIFLSALPLDNAQVGAAWASYDGARESLERLKSFGINFVYTHNYDCEPGSHLSFAEILRAADDVGMLVALSQPHFSNYDWQSPDAERTNGYAGHAEFYARVARDHPSVVAYAMSHNATSYDEAKNPDKMDGLAVERDSWSLNNVRKALRAEAIVKRLDPARIVYHHSSGDLGAMYTENFYVNFAPVQELSDWFEHWATKGVKPLFLCEYGVPFSWDWAMYRGWYKGQREWGSAQVPWELCIAEWNAQFVGDRAYRISEMEKADLRWEAAQFKSREGWHRWDYPYPVGSSSFEERNEVFAQYIRDNWRAYRTWGVSATSPWEYEIYWKPRPGIDRNRKELPVDWERLQHPGFSADYVESQYETMNLAYKRSDWVPTVAAQELIRNNRPLLSYIGGKPARFTSKDHNFHPGDMVEKQLIVINNSREPVSFGYTWSLGEKPGLSGQGRGVLQTGNQTRVPFRFTLPSTLPPGQYRLKAAVRFDAREAQEDSFLIDVTPRPEPVNWGAKIAVFDPKGETRKLLDGMGARYQLVDSAADLSRFDILVIGKQALTLNNAAPDVRRVRDGLKVIVFEQSAEVLEQRLGFRIAEYGLRQAFPRLVRHPLLDGLGQENLRDWGGEATLSSPRLEYKLKPMYGPMVKWCGIDVPHVWRCGCQGNVASVLIEKPARGDFLPIIDGGYSLQYAPLMQYREGAGMMLFCQMDVTGRTETEPAALQLTRNIFRYVRDWRPKANVKAVYVGDPAGRKQIEASGFTLGSLQDSTRPRGSLLILGPGSEKELKSGDIQNRIRSDGSEVLAVGLNATEAGALLPGSVRITNAEHIGPGGEPASFLFEQGSRGAGIGPADAHNRDPRTLPLVARDDNVTVIGDGALAWRGPVTFCQLAPWQFDTLKMNQKRTFRRSSYLLTRLIANLGVAATTPLLDDFSRPVGNPEKEHRWLDGLYLDIPEEWDDPYRFFPW